MMKLIALVLSVGFMGLSAMALFFLLRFLLLTWVVQVISGMIEATLRLIKRIFCAILFVFGPACLGAFIVGLGLQIGMNLSADAGAAPADFTMPILTGLLAFFMILAVRGWQWKRRLAAERGRFPAVTTMLDDISETAAIGRAWADAAKIAPKHCIPLLQAQKACTDLLAFVNAGNEAPDSELVETVTLIRQHLVALVASTKRRFLQSPPSGQEAIATDLVGFLIGFGQLAHEQLRKAKRAVDEEDAAMRAKLVARLFQRGEAPERASV